ncbi:hypothetical protein [Paenibacillus sp. JDR-2]|uniref:hypothetical protein n=1 Tax=Paenibacillus sp. (strain JDR-2) TaxID=324057 RepID=UPI000166486E|nr:hypothetical protein [Paenibacillus sp. JDR-2]ACT03980.1 hypothetical protein Pjdr2_5370 [Paenibacillus sp. JDR-2]
MNEKQPEWYRELRRGPHVQTTFTRDKKEAIVRRAEALDRGEKRRSRGMLRLSWAAVSFVAIAVIVAVAFREDVGAPGGYWGKGLSPNPSPTESPSPEAWPSPTPIAKGQFFVIPSKQDGYLKDALPFTTEEVKKIWVKETLIPQDRMYVILQNLNGLEMTKAASADKTLSEESLIRFETADSVYRIPYDVNTNEYLLGGRRYYADDQVMLLMHGIMEPNSKLAEIDRMFEQSRIEMETHEGGIDESFSYKGERLTVTDNSYNEWEQLLLLRSSVQPTLLGHYYDDAVQAVGNITEYSDGVMQLNRSIVFMDSNYATPDGLAVGMSKEEVVQKLGKPNLQLDSKWSYKMGDYLKFHLYFDHNRIKYIELSQPL